MVFTCTAELRKQLFSPGLLIKPLLWAMDAVLSSRSCLSILSIFQSLLLEFQQFPSTKDVFLRMKTKHAVPFIPFLMKLFDQTHRLKTSEPKCVPALVEKFKVISKNITFSTVITL